MTTSDRSIDELLSLDTYQGMSDSEIDKIMAHKISLAVGEAELNYKEDNLNSNFQDYKQKAEENRAESVLIFKRAIAASPIPESTVILEEPDLKEVSFQ